MALHNVQFVVFMMFTQFYLNKTDSMLGPADVQVIKLEDCDNPEEYPYKFVVGKVKHNRTMEFFKLNITVPQYQQLGFRVDVAKYGDGGYKPGAYHMEEEDLCIFLEQHCPDTLADLLALLEHEPGCPLRPGTYSTDRWVVDHSKLPSVYLYGDFRSDVVILDGGRDLMCYRAYFLVEPRSIVG